MAKVGNQKAVRINYGKISDMLGKEGLTARETSDLLGCNMWYLYQCKKRGVMAVESVKKLAELCNVPFETFLAETTTDEHENELEDVETLDTAKKSLQEKAAELAEEHQAKDAVVTDGEDIMELVFSEEEFRHIVTLTKHFKLQITTDLFHKLLDDAWKVYYLDRVKNELRYLSEEELEKRVVNVAMGRKKYSKDDLIRKLIDYAMSEKH